MQHFFDPIWSITWHVKWHFEVIECELYYLSGFPLKLLNFSPNQFAGRYHSSSQLTQNNFSRFLLEQATLAWKKAEFSRFEAIMLQKRTFRLYDWIKTLPRVMRRPTKFLRIYCLTKWSWLAPPKGVWISYPTKLLQAVVLQRDWLKTTSTQFFLSMVPTCIDRKKISSLEKLHDSCWVAWLDINIAVSSEEACFMFLVTLTRDYLLVFYAEKSASPWSVCAFQKTNCARSASVVVLGGSLPHEAKRANTSRN